MKHILLVASVICFTAFNAIGQQDHSNHKQLSNIFTSYTNLKNALVAGDAASAASNADHFLKSVNGIDPKIISEESTNNLVKGASKIASTKDLDKQRQHFATVSSNMVALAKAYKLSETPVYVQYCPMKKASWLSSEKEVRNPYYGKTMLTCGEVTETL